MIVVEVKKNPAIGLTTSYTTLGHKHLEKGQPVPISIEGRYRGYRVPTDLLRMVLGDELVDQISEVTFFYEEKEVK
jgi:hypothetical protein